MIFESEVLGYKCSVSFFDDRAAFRCELIEGRDFDTFAKLEAAIKSRDLSMRKNFTNKIAYGKAGFGDNGIIAIEVTSIDGSQAWTKTINGKSKRSLSSLFADKDEVQSAIDFEKDCREKIEAAWKAVKRWTPQS